MVSGDPSCYYLLFVADIRRNNRSDVVRSGRGVRGGSDAHPGRGVTHTQMRSDAHPGRGVTHTHGGE